MNHGEDHEGKEVLDEKDEDGEGVLDVLVWPDLHTDGVAGPGQGDGLQGLECQYWGGEGEGDQPDRKIDKSNFCVSHFSRESVIDLSNGEPSVNCYCSDGAGGHEDVGPLEGGDQLAGQEAQVPPPALQALDQGGGQAEEGGGDPGTAQVHNINVLRCPVHWLPCNRNQINQRM